MAEKETKTETTPITEEQTAALKKQIDFYFSDSNYTKDTFLRKTAHDNGGWIPVSVLTTFNKVKCITVDEKVIADTMSDSEIVEVSEDKTKLKRKLPLPEDDVVSPRSIYAKGLPQDEKKTNIDSLTEYFSKFGTVLSVRIRRVYKKKEILKGSAYIEYDTKATAENVVNTCGPFKFGENPLIVKMKERYLQDKKEETRQKKRKRINSEEKFPPGTLLKFKHLPEEVTRDMIKAFFQDHGQVAFVDTNKSPEYTYVRFKKDLRATICISTLEDKEAKIGDHVIKPELLKGDEEQAYWKDNVKGQKKKKRKTKY